MVVLGATVALVPESPVPPQTVRAMVEGACVNVEAVLEEFDAKERGYYLPPRDGRVFCFVPLREGVNADAVWAAVRAPVRVLAEAAGEPGLMVFPPGSDIVRLSALGEEAGLEEAMVYVLVDFLEGAESVKAVREGGRVVVSVGGVRVRTDYQRFNRVLGSLPVSVLGCVAAQVLGVPVRVLEERPSGRNVTAILEVLERRGQA